LACELRRRRTARSRQPARGAVPASCTPAIASTSVPYFGAQVLAFRQQAIALAEGSMRS
jgi:hypothetical protein